jgi:hypothetical protein
MLRGGPYVWHVAPTLFSLVARSSTVVLRVEWSTLNLGHIRSGLDDRVSLGHIGAIPQTSPKDTRTRDATRRNSTQRPLAASKHLRGLQVDLNAMTKLTTAASIGIGVPLGVILIACIAGIIYSVTAKRKAPRGDIELTKTDPEAPPAPAPKVIKWNPHGAMASRS